MEASSVRTTREIRAEKEAKAAKLMREGKDAVEAAFWAWTYNRAGQGETKQTEQALQDAMAKLNSAAALLGEIESLS